MLWEYHNLQWVNSQIHPHPCSSPKERGETAQYMNSMYFVFSPPFREDLGGKIHPQPGPLPRRGRNSQMHEPHREHRKHRKTLAHDVNRVWFMFKRGRLNRRELHPHPGPLPRRGRNSPIHEPHRNIEDIEMQLLTAEVERKFQCALYCLFHKNQTSSKMYFLS